MYQNQNEEKQVMITKGVSLTRLAMDLLGQPLSYQGSDGREKATICTGLYVRQTYCQFSSLDMSVYRCLHISLTDIYEMTCSLVI